MRLRTVFEFLLGRREAIEQVARARESIWIGVAFVLMAGVARQYDQSFILEAPERWFIGPLAFSLVTGAILFSLAVPGLPRAEDAKRTRHNWASFMGCYWLTAPLAWLYAIPVERFLASKAAVAVNLALFIVVALWRVGLMGKVVSVVTGIGLSRAVARVALVAAAEFVVMWFFIDFGEAVARGMMGMENSPEEKLTRDVAGAAAVVALFFVPISAIYLFVAVSPRVPKNSFPARSPSGFQWKAVGAIAAAWALIALYPQAEQANSAKVARFMKQGETRAALDFMALKGPRAFAPSRPAPPKLYELNMYEEMGKVFTALKADDPEWIRQLYLDRLRVMFSIRPIGYRQTEFVRAMPAMFESAARLPGSREWARANSELLDSWFEKLGNKNDSDYYNLRKAYEKLLSEEPK